MDRHPLERASWIAAIVSAIVAVLIWLKPFGGELENSLPIVVPSTTKVSQPREGSFTSTSGDVPHQIEPTRNDNDLSAEVPLADAIYNVDNRDTAYIRIINQALALNDYAFARSIIEKIFNINTRDRMYVKAIDQAIAQEHFDIAERMAPEIFNVDIRDKVLNRILDARAQSVASAATHSLPKKHHDKVPTLQPVVRH